MDYEPTHHINIQKLSRAISAKLNLPQDDSLAFVIGSGVERTSIEAVTTWLQKAHPDTIQLPLRAIC